MILLEFRQYYSPSASFRLFRDVLLTYSILLLLAVFIQVLNLK